MAEGGGSGKGQGSVTEKLVHQSLSWGRSTCCRQSTDLAASDAGTCQRVLGAAKLTAALKMPPEGEQESPRRDPGSVCSLCRLLFYLTSP